MNGIIYFYNVNSKFGYFMRFPLCLQISQRLYLIIFFAACVVFIRMKKVYYDEYYLFLTGLFVLILPIAYVLAGDPAVPRYFGVSILLMSILSVYALGRYADGDESLRTSIVEWERVSENLWDKL